MAVWCIGEYGDMLVNNIGVLDREEPVIVSTTFSYSCCVQPSWWLFNVEDSGL